MYQTHIHVDQDKLYKVLGKKVTKNVTVLARKKLTRKKVTGGVGPVEKK